MPSRYASVREQLVQHITRYAFVVLAVLYFRLPGAQPPVWLELATLDLLFVAHALFCTWSLLHTLRRPASPLRFRAAMWLDIATVALVVANDPAPVPPSALAFIMVVLGNGMRYGMPLFAEGIVGAIGFGVVSIALNRYLGGAAWSLPLLYLTVIGAIIVAYAYLLMGRIEESRTLLERHSRLDALTGLINRRALFEAARRLFSELDRQGGRLVVMFADMDRFKAVNDQHGHAVGDQVLTQFGTLIGRSVREYDVAARYGGDEFVVILVDASLDQAELVARRIQKGIERWTAEFGVDCSITFGLAEAPTHGDSLPELLNHVDAALYRSKRAQRRGGVERVAVAAPAVAMPE